MSLETKQKKKIQWDQINQLNEGKKMYSPEEN